LSNEKEIRYLDLEAQKMTLQQAIEETRQHKAILEKLPPKTVLYNFTVCHGYFTRVE